MPRLCVLELVVETPEERVDVRDEELKRLELEVVGVLDVDESTEELLVLGVPELVVTSCVVLEVLRDTELEIEELELLVATEELDDPTSVVKELRVDDGDALSDVLVAIVEVTNVELAAVEDGDEGAT